MTAAHWHLFSIKLTATEGRLIKRLAKQASVTPHAWMRDIIRAALAAQKEIPSAGATSAMPRRGVSHE